MNSFRIATVIGALITTALVVLAGPAFAQTTKMNLPGCGPAQEAIYKAGLTARQDAYDAAKETNNALRTELRQLTDSYARLGCAGTSGGGGECANIRASVAETRSDIAENGKYISDLANAVNAYRTQQPFVTPTGEACLRCKSPGDFACENPGVVPGFKPPAMPAAPSTRPSSARNGHRVKPSQSPSIPRVIRECEPICGTWTLEGDHYNAVWDNGARAIIRYQFFNDGRVVFIRRDTAQVGFTARYEGRISRNQMEGTVTWSSNGRSWSGTWTAEMQSEISGNESTILGRWRRKSDNSVVEFTRQGNIIVGRIHLLGPLGQYGFTTGEETFRLTPSDGNTYSGQVKWRSPDGRQWWQATTQVVSGNDMRGAGDWVRVR